MTKHPPFLTSDWVQARLYHLLAPLVALALVAVFEPTRLAQRIEYLTVNLRFEARAPFDPPADPRLYFVGIDQHSLDDLGRWPWPRKVEADFLKAIANARVNPHTVIFDVLFTEPSSPGKTDPDDEALADAAGELPSVVTGAFSQSPTANPQMEQADEKETEEELTQPSYTVPYPNIHGDVMKINGFNVAKFPIRPLRQQSFFGFVNDEPSPIDDMRHTIPLLIRVRDKVYPSLALQGLCQMLHVDPDKVEITVGQSVKLKNSSGKTWTIPIDEKGEVLINYRRQSSFYPDGGGSFVNVVQTLGLYTKDPVKYPLQEKYDIRNKVVVVGETAIGLTDLGPTPLQAQSALAYTHLNVMNNVLRNDYLKLVPSSWVVIGWALVTWATLLRLKEAPLIEAVLLPIIMAIFYTVFAFAIFWQWSLQIALAWPVLSYGVVNFGGGVLRWREEQRGRLQLKQIFSRMLSPEIMNHLLDHPENMKLGGSLRDATVLFSDIRDYTKFSEGLPAGELVRQLNIYFERMVACVKENRGTFHKFIGDAVMAAWGDIAATSSGAGEDARNAVRAALQMRLHLRDLNVERQTEGLIPLRIGIGLNHGEVLAGLIGASSKAEFTVMGDAVNVASRLEGMTKTFHTDLAISESVRQLLGDAFLVRRLGLIQLKGKTRPTVVYEVLAEKGGADEAAMTEACLARYEEAFDHFLGRRFAQAEAGFFACEKEHPTDYCVKSYLQASRDFHAQPPPPEWDGRIVMETK